MKRPSYARRALAAIVAALLPLAGLAVVPSQPAVAASAPAADLRVQAIYFQHTGNKSQRDLVLSSMAAGSTFRSRIWTDFLNSWDAANKGVKVYTSTPKELPGSGHVFVVLGSALSKSGKMTAKIERRLKVALKALAKYPKSAVLVSGGAPRKGHTEAGVMRAWLLAKGIKSSRILVEAKAASTVGNAKNSMTMLHKSGRYSSYTLISDASHIRRSTILFDAAKVLLQEQSGKAWNIESVANVAYSDSSIASRGPVPAATATIISSNVASVFGFLAKYKSLVSSPPASAKLTSLKVKAPKLLTYQVGQALDPAGLAVTAIFNKGIWSKPVPAATISGFRSAEVGKVSVKVSYTHGKVSKSATFVCEVVRAASTVAVKLPAARIRKSRTRPVVSATTETATRIPASGKVKFYLDGKELKTVVLTAGDNGLAKLKLPKIAKTGKHTVTVRYLGSSKVVAATRTVTIKVVK